MTMTGRERVINAIERKRPDKVPLRIFPAPGGLYEHGQKLVDLIKECGHDFGDLSDLKLPPPPAPQDFDEDGRYYSVKKDEWGITWEYRIFGIWGHPCEWPLNDLGNLKSYQPPKAPPAEGEDFENLKKRGGDHRKNYYQLELGGSLFEQLHSVRQFEDVLMDIYMNTPEINEIADMVTDYVQHTVNRAILLGADGIIFGDDYGTQQSLLVSLDLWRKFFKPRYKAVFDPIIKSGKKIFFHSCGKISDLFDEFHDLGVNVIWPQLPAYNADELSRKCRDLDLTIELHPDRGDLMQKGSTDEIRRYVDGLVEKFDPLSGGSWFYIEIDPGFPWRNVEALFESVMAHRK